MCDHVAKPLMAAGKNDAKGSRNAAENNRIDLQHTEGRSDEYLPPRASLTVDSDHNQPRE